jgi:UDP-glucuronate 4-epimerase
MNAPVTGEWQTKTMAAMTQPTYLVTGAAGFIGSHLVEALLRRGSQVIGLDNFDDFYDPAIKRRNIQWAATQPNFRLVEGDVRDAGLLEDLFAGNAIDCVFHLAARAGVRPSIANPLLYQSVNVEGTSILLETMRRHGVKRLMFASSSSVYGNNPSVPFRETDNVDRPISPYAATKKGGELLCYTYHHLFGFDVACLRFFTVYGPRQRPEMAIHNFTRMIAEGEELPMYGDGSTARDYTYIDDIIQGLLAIERNLSGYHILNLGESQTTTLRGLIDMIGEALGREPRIRQLPLQPGDVEITYADITAARALGYRPETPIAEGVRKFVAWYRRQLVEVQ